MHRTWRRYEEQEGEEEDLDLDREERTKQAGQAAASLLWALLLGGGLQCHSYSMRPSGSSASSRYLMRITYEPIPEEGEDDEGAAGSTIMSPPVYGSSRGGMWGAWPVVISLLLFSSAGFMGARLTSRSSRRAAATPIHFRGQDRASLMLQARQHQSHVQHKQGQHKADQQEAPTGGSGSSSCVLESTFSWTVSDCDCDSTQVVLAGADPVAYFSLSVGEPYVPGSPDYSTTLNGYTFYFSTAENLALFEADPWAYAPSYGAFCSWGMSEERMPDYNWGPTNLGPNADLNLWLVRNGRLFFFYKQEAMEKFLVDPDQFMLDGDERWSEWFGSKETSPFNTACYVQEDEEESRS